jgi:hypothetical protein
MRTGVARWVAGAVMMAVGTAAQAATITQLMNAPAHIFFSDEDGEAFLDNNSNGVIDPGDVFRGAVSFDQFRRNNEDQVPLLHAVGNSEVGGVFQIKVVSKTPRGPFFPGQYNYTFAPDPAFEALHGPGAMVVLWEDPAPGLSDFVINSAASQAASIATVTDGNVFLVLGFSQEGNGWFGQGSDNPTPLSNPSDRLAISIFALSRVSTEGVAGGYSFATLSNNAGTGEFIGTSNIGGPFAGSPWPLSSESDVEFQLLAVPTPSALFGGAVMMLGLLRRTRR